MAWSNNDGEPRLGFVSSDQPNEGSLPFIHKCIGSIDVQKVCE